MNLTYFLPGATGAPSGAQIARRWPHLAHVFGRGANAACAACHAGPGGLSGVLVAAHGLPQFDPAKQTWTVYPNLGPSAGASPEPGSPRRPELPDAVQAPAPWMGVPTAAADRPAPDELLARETTLDGVDVVLADGRAWRIPVVRLVNGDTRLPCLITLDDAGCVRRRAKPEHYELLHLSDRVWQSELGGEPVTTADVFRLAALALGVNYRVGPAELSALELLDTDGARKIADAVLDGANFRALLEEQSGKKNGATTPGRTSSPGDAARPGTVLPAPK